MREGGRETDSASSVSLALVDPVVVSDLADTRAAHFLSKAMRSRANWRRSSSYLNIVICMRIF